MALLPLSVSASLLLVLSSLSLQASALQARSQVQAGQRLLQAEDQLMSAAQHLAAQHQAANPQAVEQLAGRVGHKAQVGPVAYRLVRLDGPSWSPQPAAAAPQQGQAELTLELLPSADQPRPLRAAFALELARASSAAGPGPVQLQALRELGLRGRAAVGVAP